jgi:DNA invertase Pin-like site-specific DNA recombinase
MTDTQAQLIGYARVSTVDQNLDLQVRALTGAGVAEDQIYTDVMSGAKLARPGLNAAMRALRAGDTLMIWKLDRLGRSVVDVLETVKVLTDDDIKIVSLTENLDGRTAMGKFVLTLLAAFAEMERNLIVERTQAGLRAAKERGKKLGRTDVMTPELQEVVEKLLAEEPPLTMNEIARRLPVSRAKFFNWMRERRERLAAEERKSNA